MAYRIFKDAASLDSYHQSLHSNGTTIIALDFEGEFNLHAYGETLCLIQIFDGENEIIIDPFDVPREAIKKLLEDEKIMKIMWDASSDLSLVINGYDMTIKSILDLRPAADLLDLPKKDYSSVLQSILKQQTMNKSRFQRYNWMKRPVEADAIRYALDDVLHLFSLKDALLKRIYEGDHMDEYLRLNLLAQNRNYLREPGQRHKKMKGYRYLRREEQDRLKRLFDLRDTKAQKLNWPPHRVIPNPQLMDLARGDLRPEKISFDRKMQAVFRTGLINELVEELKKG